MSLFSSKSLDQLLLFFLVDCYGWNGMGDQAIELYRKMPEELIDEVTHVRVLNACSQSGLVDEARSIFQNIQIKTERIYSTMVYEKNLSLSSNNRNRFLLINISRSIVLVVHPFMKKQKN